MSQQTTAQAHGGPDVRQLRQQELPAGEFPAGGKQDFRVYFAEAAHKRIWDHAAQNVSVEICGVLVGRWQRDDNGPFVTVSEMIRCDTAASKFAEVTFTHEAWSRIHEEMDTRFSDLNIVGWYHSHPDFGIFLSDRDRFIQEHFFAGPGQIAHVVDPVRQSEGVFVWQNGQPTSCRHFWIGNRIPLGHAAAEEEAPSAGDSAGSESEKNAARTSSSPGTPRLEFTGRLLAFLAVFLMGYLLAGMRTSWESQRLIEGTVAHYGLWKGLRPGLKEGLQEVDAQLKTLSGELQAWKTAGGNIKEGGESRSEQWNQMQQRLQNSRRLLTQIQSLYCLTESEADTVRKLFADKLGELRRSLNSKPRSSESDDGEAGDAAKSSESAEPSGSNEKRSEDPPSPKE